ncbi:unnamed protein product, partial [Ectocarpus fasciculatus]
VNSSAPTRSTLRTVTVTEPTTTRNADMMGGIVAPATVPMATIPAASSVTIASTSTRRVTGPRPRHPHLEPRQRPQFQGPPQHPHLEPRQRPLFQ